MSSPFDSLPKIDFAVKDASEIERAVITGFEAAWLAAENTVLTLYPADPRRLFLLTIADLIVAQRCVIDFAAKQNLLKYSRNGYLDNLGALYGERGARLQAAAALTTLRFTVTTPMAFNVLIPVDTRAGTSGGAGQIVFATTEGVTLMSGQSSVEVAAQCLTTGTLANGILAGQLNTLINWALPFAATVTNTTTTHDGSDVETDDHYRDRLWYAPESFSTTGPRLAYRWWGMTADPRLLDVFVYSHPDIAGEVWLYPLMLGGELPSQEVMDKVYAACNDERRRPLTDQVHVALPTLHTYTVDLTYWLWDYDQTTAAEITTRVHQAVDQWILWERSEVGRDIIPSKLVQMIHDAGVKRVEVTSPPFVRLAITPGSPPTVELAVISGDPIVAFGGFENH